MLLTLKNGRIAPRVTKAEMLRAVEIAWRLFDAHGPEIEQHEDTLYLACDEVAEAYHERREVEPTALQAVRAAAVKSRIRGAALQLGLGLGLPDPPQPEELQDRRADETGWAAMNLPDEIAHLRDGLCGACVDERLLEEKR